jgi:hypothetical protein
MEVSSQPPTPAVLHPVNMRMGGTYSRSGLLASAVVVIVVVPVIIFFFLFFFLFFLFLFILLFSFFFFFLYTTFQRRTFISLTDFSQSALSFLSLPNS